MGRGKELGDNWTYEKDANLLTVVFIVQIFAYLPMCLVASLPLRMMALNSKPAVNN